LFSLGPIARNRRISDSVKWAFSQAVSFEILANHLGRISRDHDDFRRSVFSFGRPLPAADSRLRSPTTSRRTAMIALAAESKHPDDANRLAKFLVLLSQSAFDADCVAVLNCETP